MSGTVLGLTIACAAVVTTGSVLPVCGLLVESAALAGAADAAALAGADAASGRMSGLPCEVAGSLAAANGVELAGCSVDGMVVTVVVERWVGAVPVRTVATAGPAP